MSIPSQHPHDGPSSGRRSTAGGASSQRLRAWTLTALLPLAVLPFGTVHDSAWWALSAAASTGALVVGVRSWRNLGSLPRPAILSLCLAALAQLLAAGSLVAVGPAARARLQPGLAELLDTSLGFAPTVIRPLAVDPEGALISHAAAGAMLALAGVASVALRRRRHARILAWVVIGSALGVGLLAAVHRIANTTSIWFVSGVPSAAREDFFAPFVNPNHAGHLVAAAVPLALALTWGSFRNGRVASGVALVVLLGLAWATQSRGAVLESAIGIGLVLALVGPRVLRVGVVAGGAVSIGLVLGTGVERAAAALSRLWQRDAQLPDPFGQRQTIWRDSLDLVESAPWVGVGPGGFHDAFPTVKTLPNYAMAAHAHLEPLELVVERGLPGSLLLLSAGVAAVGWAAWHTLRLPEGRKRTLLAGLLGALGALATATCYDFPLRIGALATLGALLMGATVGLAEHERSAPSRGLHRLGIAAVLLLSLSSLATGVWSLAGGPGGAARSIEPALAESVAARRDGRTSASAELEAALRDAIARRPLAHRPLLELAEVRHAAGDPAAALAIVTHTSDVYPTLPWPWLARARLLAEAGEMSAAQETWRTLLALDLPGENGARPYLQEALRTGEDPGTTALAIAPERADRVRTLARMVAIAGDPLISELLYEKSILLEPESRLAYAMELTRWKRPQEALDQARGFPETHCLAARVRGEAHLQLGDPDAALTAFRGAVDRCPAHVKGARSGLERARKAVEATRGMAP